MEDKQQQEIIPSPQMPAPKRSFFMMRRNKFIIGLLLLLLLAGVAAAFVLQKDKQPETNNEQPGQSSENKETNEDPSTLRMLATGDWIAHDSINAQAKTANGDYDYAQFLTGMKSFFKDSDVNFCNVATLAGGEQFGISGYPTFNAPTQWLTDMNSFGCNLYNTGTNHTNDKGQAAITAELKHLEGLSGILAHAGANSSNDEQAKVRYFEVKGIKFAFLSYSTYSNAPNPNPYSLNRFSDELVVPQMTEARLQADVVIVSMRWGTEYSSSVNAAQDEAAKKLTNLGADIILGHGSHVLQPVKRIKGELPDGKEHEAVVWYSLGNFLNTQLETEALTGCVAQFDFDVATKKITQVMCLPFYMHYEWTAEEKAAEDLLARKNIQIVPLYSAAALMEKSQLGTSVEAQTERIRTLINTYTEIPVQNATDL